MHNIDLEICPNTLKTRRFYFKIYNTLLKIRLVLWCTCKPTAYPKETSKQMLSCELFEIHITNFSMKLQLWYDYSWYIINNFLTLWYTHCHWCLFNFEALRCGTYWRAELKKEISLFKTALQKKWSFPLGISSVDVTKSAVSSGFGHIYWRNV